jgi:hypothetical protein
MGAGADSTAIAARHRKGRRENLPVPSPALPPARDGAAGGDAAGGRGLLLRLQLWANLRPRAILRRPSPAPGRRSRESRVVGARVVVGVAATDRR